MKRAIITAAAEEPFAPARMRSIAEPSVMPQAGPLAADRGSRHAKSPHPIDLHVGGRILARRKQLGMSQEGLATALGVTFQQVQKYEQGSNRISASRLQRAAAVLGVPVSHFFDGAPDRLPSPGVQQPPCEIDRFLASDDGAALADAFSRIRDHDMRRSIVAFVTEVAEADETDEPAAAREDGAAEARDAVHG